jgi:hypothetical protein
MMRIMAFFSVLAVLTGCMSVKTSLLYVEYIGNEEIYDITITSRKGFCLNYLFIKANAGNGYIGEFPYPDEYTLTWLDSDRKAHSKTIDLRKENSGNLSDDNLNLEFRISQDNEVTVHAAKWLDSPKR